MNSCGIPHEIFRSLSLETQKLVFLSFKIKHTTHHALYMRSYCQIWCSANLSGVLFDFHSIFKLDACDDFVQVFKAA
jgi:hypothetical protein